MPNSLQPPPSSIYDEPPFWAVNRVKGEGRPEFQPIEWPPVPKKRSAIDTVNDYFRSKVLGFGERLGHDYTETRSAIGQWLRENLPGLIEGMATGTGPTGPMIGALSRGNAAYEAVARGVRRMVEERKAAGTYGRAPDVPPTPTERLMQNPEQRGSESLLEPAFVQERTPYIINAGILNRAIAPAGIHDNPTWDIRTQHFRTGLLPEAWSPIKGRGYPGWAPAEYIGTQDFPGPPHPKYGNKVELFNLTEDIPGHPAGSTVSRQTLEDFGFEVPSTVGLKPKSKPVPQTDTRTWDELTSEERNAMLSPFWRRP